MQRSLFIGNIPYGAMEREIHELFSTCGEVHDVHFVMDYKRGRFRGFGFVRMADADAEKAITELHDREFQGRRLIVREARNEESSGNRRSA
jgi:RNA recognition motif-containing protein